MKSLFVKSILYALVASTGVIGLDNYFGADVGKSDIFWAVFVFFGLLITVIKDIIDHKINTTFLSVFLSILISIACSLLVKFAGLSEFYTYFFSLFTSIFAPSILIELMDKGLVKYWSIKALDKRFNTDSKKEDDDN